MDGNGRWATQRGRPRAVGHRAGADSVRRVVEAAPGLGITTLTLYAFSSDNWARPPLEVQALFQLFRRYLKREPAELAQSGVRLSIIGRRDRLPDDVRRLIALAERRTAAGRRLHLRVAIDYSARDAIVAAAARARRERGAALTRELFARWLGEAMNCTEPAPDVDLLIRTGGEQRLSDFLLWECAYAELVFTRTMWPDFSAAELAEAVGEFQGRERRFGRVAG